MIQAIKNWLERRNAMRRFEAVIKERDHKRKTCSHHYPDGRTAWVKVLSRPGMAIVKDLHNYRRPKPVFAGEPVLSASCSLCHRHWSGKSFSELESLPPPLPKDFRTVSKPNGDFEVLPRPPV